MAKMGISTIRSYRGAKIFESIGLNESLLKTYFGTETSTVGGIGLNTIAHDAIALHDIAFNKTSDNQNADLKAGLASFNGLFHWRKHGTQRQ